MEDSEKPVKRNSQRRDNRMCAVQYLYQWELNKPEELSYDIRQFFENQDQPHEYYAFAEELVCGAIEHIGHIDEEIKSHTENWSFERIAKVDLSVLRLAIYELLHRKDIPPIVSINEAIELGKIYSTPDSKRFINGILDKMKGKITRPLRKAED
ncbi:MAG: N utilization substance protein B [Lentimonas sp.]|jgi:N utilization substance protein B